MARTTLTVQQVTLAGLAPTYAAATVTDGDAFANDGNVLVHVKNTNAATRTLTIQTPAKVAGVDVAEVTVTIPANTGDVMIGPFDPSIFNQADGKVYLDWSAVTNVTVAAIRLG